MDDEDDKDSEVNIDGEDDEKVGANLFGVDKNDDY